MYLIKEMPKNERPRERLKNDGIDALSNLELIALLLRTGKKDLSVIELSKRVLYHLESLEDLKRISLEELSQIPGIKEAKATTLIAAIELGKRLSSNIQVHKKKIESPYDVYQLMHASLSHLEQEHFMCLYLNTKSELIKKETIFVGTINQTLIHPREIFRTAIKISCSSVIFIHNHPSGDSSPSSADLISTKNLIDASKAVGIHVVDHIIIGKNEFFSIMENKKHKG
jgi:DNA repair protein RadC